MQVYEESFIELFEDNDIIFPGGQEEVESWVKNILSDE
jgi:hypothetical protein